VGSYVWIVAALVRVPVPRLHVRGLQGHRGKVTAAGIRENEHEAY
jgi:hypothetical protein